MAKRLQVKHKDYHHRKPRSLGKPNCCNLNDPANLSHVGVVPHRAWHGLFRNMTAPDIARLITKVWLDPDYYFVCVPRQKGRKPRKPVKVLHDDPVGTVIYREK